MIESELLESILPYNNHKVLERLRSDAKMIKGNTFIFDRFDIIFDDCYLCIDFERHYEDFLTQEDADYIHSLIPPRNYSISASKYIEKLYPFTIPGIEYYSDFIYYFIDHVPRIGRINDNGYTYISVDDIPVIKVGMGNIITPEITKYIPELGNIEDECTVGELYARRLIMMLVARVDDSKPLTKSARFTTD